MEFGIRVGTAEGTSEGAMRYTLDVHLWMGGQNLHWRLGVDTRPGKMIDMNVSRGGDDDVSPTPAAASDEPPLPPPDPLP